MMSRESAFGTQTRPYPSQYFHSPLAATSHAQPGPQQTGKSPDGVRLFMELGTTGYQTPQPSTQIDWIINTLRQEAAKHNETRLALHSSYQAQLQTEQLLVEERASTHALRVRAQEIEMRSVYLEGQLRACEQHHSNHIVSTVQ